MRTNVLSKKTNVSSQEVQSQQYRLVTGISTI